ncbi:MULTISPECIES: LON peptidase substrate-binding domain-containing protein [Mumia]|uniref:LON peptidase substrate-binding domain-containing protein n=1 Tax=Mumia TaxID=1546255 RepID=UPI001420D971|nr:MULTISPECIES: LON peptidase substrate-binding domain-containing protein [unclassified Mumia]QMW67782.1 LON peptidase substrate-binding domain-containing protein [Mumia sp. ZJ1417]
MARSIPLFPLGSVVLPGQTLSLHVFEDRYRELVAYLLTLPEAERRFGIVSIREGYEVGESGVQSIHRVGVEVALTDVTGYDDGRYDLTVDAIGRIRLDAGVTGESFMWGHVEDLDEPVGEDVTVAADRAHAVFDAYRIELNRFRLDAQVEELPGDPVDLSYLLASSAVLTLPDRQELLEADDAAERLRYYHHLMVTEIAAMRAVPSLPAVDVARTSWSPN